MIAKLMMMRRDRMTRRVIDDMKETNDSQDKEDKTNAHGSKVDGDNRGLVMTDIEDEMRDMGFDIADNDEMGFGMSETGDMYVEMPDMSDLGGDILGTDGRSLETIEVPVVAGGLTGLLDLLTADNDSGMDMDLGAILGGGISLPEAINKKRSIMSRLLVDIQSHMPHLLLETVPNLGQSLFLILLKKWPR